MLCVLLYEMLLREQINSDLKESMKAGDAFRVGVLRMLISAFNNKGIEKRGKGMEAALSEDETLEVLRKEAKKRKEAIEAFRGGGREDLAKKESDELVYIQAYLPAELSAEEIQKVIDGVLAQNPGATQKEFGTLMGAIMATLKGKAEASTVSVLLKKTLAK